MDFIKDLLKLQHTQTLHQVSTKLVTDDFEKELLYGETM